jgi:hypothetical protein
VSDSAPRRLTVVLPPLHERDDTGPLLDRLEADQARDAGTGSRVVPGGGTGGWDRDRLEAGTWIVAAPAGIAVSVVWNCALLSRFVRGRY